MSLKNQLRMFCAEWYSDVDERHHWCRVTTLYRGEDYARVSIVSPELGRRFMSKLIARYGGFYRGLNFIREDGRGVSQ